MIIPIGTKSTLALRPAITIGLIAANIIVAIISFPLSMNTEKKVFEVRRDRYARQVKLFIAEQETATDNPYDTYLRRHTDGAVKKIENARDYYDLEMAIMDALLLSGASFDELEEFEQVLAERTELDYMDIIDGTAEDFDEWTRLRAREEKTIAGDVVYSFGLVPSKMSRAHTFITHIFLHGGIWHLLGNMLFLWIVGCLMEDSWGRGPFLAFYLCGGIFAGLAHCLQDTSSAVPLIGASGAIAAAMGAFTVRHFWTKIKFFYFFVFIFRPFWGTFYLPACVFLPFWFIQQVTLKYLTDFVGGGGGVAYLAHIAGYLGGVIAALVFRATGFEERFLAPRLAKKQIDAGVLKDPRFDRACDYMAKKQFDKAMGIFDSLVAERPDDLATIHDIAMIYKEYGLNPQYHRLSDRVLKKALLNADYDEAADIALDISNARDRVPVNPQLMMRVGKWLTDQDRFGEAHDIYRFILQNDAPPQVQAKVSISLARLLNGPMGNPRNALAVLEDASALELDAEWKERIYEMTDWVKETMGVGTVI